MRTLVLAVVLALSACSSFGQTLVFPHFANGVNEDGTVWSTEIDLVNTTSAEQSVKLWFMNPDGSPKVVSLPGFENLETGIAAYSEVTLAMSPGSMRVLETDGLAETQSAGWLWVEGSEGVKAAVTFRLRHGEGQIMAQAGVMPSAPTRSVDFIPVVPVTNVDPNFVNPTERSMALALANTSDTDADGEIQLVSDSGELMATSAFVLPPWGQMAQFVSELFEQDGWGRYYLRVQVTSGSVAAMALSTVGSLISSVPAN